MTLGNGSVARCERKLVPSQAQLVSLREIAKLHFALFRPSFSPRIINNIYFDSPELESYWANIDGVASRQKVRLRWYGDHWNQIEAARLEIKIKNGYRSRKIAYPIVFRALEQLREMDFFSRILRQPTVPQDVRTTFAGYAPTLINRYSREYYTAADSRFTLTIDTAIRYYMPMLPLRDMLLLEEEFPQAVVELKYPSELDEQAQTYAAAFPFAVQRNSKYINGIQALRRWCALAECEHGISNYVSQR